MALSDYEHFLEIEKRCYLRIAKNEKNIPYRPKPKRKTDRPPRRKLMPTPTEDLKALCEMYKRLALDDRGYVRTEAKS